MLVSWVELCVVSVPAEEAVEMTPEDGMVEVVPYVTTLGDVVLAAEVSYVEGVSVDKMLVAPLTEDWEMRAVEEEP